MTITQVKFCGLKTLSAIEDAIHAGAHYLGFVFVAKSARYIDGARLKEISNFFNSHQAIRNKVKIVALFVNPQKDYVQDIITALQPDILQFHASHDEYETPEFCRSFNLPYIKAIPFGLPTSSWEDYELRYYDAFALLADAHGVQAGGSGACFDWTRIPAQGMRKIPLFLAGGLTDNNVQKGIVSCEPIAVDVSSGIEISTGIKSYERMCAFISQVHLKNEIK